MSLIDNAKIRLDVAYHPFSGHMKTVELDIHSTLDEMMEEQQTDYNPMVGVLGIRVNAQFVCDGTVVKQNKDGMIFIENYGELYASEKSDREQLDVLKDACDIQAEWIINEDGDGISCNVVEIQAKVLKAYDHNFDIEVDVIDCCDAVSGDMYVMMENVLDIREYAHKKYCEDGFPRVEDLGVMAIDDIKCADERICKDALEWVIENMPGILSNYVPTSVYLVTLDKDQAYYYVCEDTKKTVSNLLMKNGFEQYEDTNSMYKWMMG